MDSYNCFKASYDETLDLGEFHQFYRNQVLPFYRVVYTIHGHYTDTISNLPASRCSILSMSEIPDLSEGKTNTTFNYSGWMYDFEMQVGLIIYSMHTSGLDRVSAYSLSSGI